MANIAMLGTGLSDRAGIHDWPCGGGQYDQGAGRQSARAARQDAAGVDEQFLHR